MSPINDVDGMANIKVVGVGGGGCNAVARMMKEQITGVHYLCVNTDAQALMRTEAPVRIRIGDHLTRGLGVGGDPEKGRQSAEESREELTEALKNCDMVFIAAGMGGGTGTGAAPVVGEIAKRLGALTVGIVTKPFAWEGAHRRKMAEEGLARLRERVDATVVVPNDKLLTVCDKKLSTMGAFKMADDVLKQAIEAIAEVITTPGEINLDFADVRTIMGGAGATMFGIGRGSGDNRAAEAALAATTNPLLDIAIEGAKGIIFNITGGVDLTMREVNAAAEVMSKAADPDAKIFFGMVTDPKMEDMVKVTLIATGFPTKDKLATSVATSDNLWQPLLEKTEVSPSSIDVPPFLRQRVGAGNHKSHAPTSR